MNQHLATSLQIYNDHKIDFPAMFAWHLHHGIVFTSFDGFGMAYYTHHEDPDSPVDIQDSDTLFVTMCCGRMQKCLAAFHGDFEFIAFQRSFKNSPIVRTYPMKKFIKTLNMKY